MTPRGRVATGWAVGLLALGLALASAPGVSADEAATLDLGREAAGHLVRAPADPGAARRGLVGLATAAQRPLLAEAIHGFAAEGGARAGLGPLRGARLAAVAAAALLAALLALLGFDLAGLAGGLLAPALLFLSPRGVTAGLVATPDLLGALLALAALAAFSRSLERPTRLARGRAGVAAGLLCGLAAAVRPDLWTLLPIFASLWLLGRLHLWRQARRAGAAQATAPAATGPNEDWAERLRRVPVALVAAATLGALVVLLADPRLWADPLRGALQALRVAHGLDGPGGPPAWSLAAALPLPLAALYLVGLAHAALRLAGALRDGHGRTVRTEALLLGAAGTWLLLAALGLAPRRPGLAPILPALALLALLGARALAALARTAWPARSGTLAAALALLTLYPGLRAAVTTFPLGASAWGEAVGGPPGAAALGLPSQDGGEPVRAVLAEVARHAAPGARVRWIGVAPGAVARYRAAGLVRADLVDVDDPSSADLALAAYLPASRDETFRAWGAFRSSRPVAGAYLEEVPLAQVFARPGAWR